MTSYALNDQAALRRPTPNESRSSEAVLTTSRSPRTVNQKTLKTSIGCTGIGLHSGARVSMTIHPASPGAGIVFRRTDLRGAAALVPATWQNVIDTQLCTAIGNGQGARIGTIEHLMAALYGCEIDNALIDIDGPEVPVMDGSAAPFVFLIECAGSVDQAAVRRGIEVRREISVVEDDCRMTLAPPARGGGLALDFEIDFGTTAVSRQTCQLAVAPEVFKSNLARARTFGFAHDIDRLQAAGLARGGSLENAIVISGDRILNDDGLRFEDEFVRHKMLDCVGDLYLAGAPVLGRVIASRSGHRHNNRLLHALFATPDAFRYVELVESSADQAAWRIPAIRQADAGRLGVGAAD
ncbi:MAG TPA: UDP-3-O-acyl-N-acetylglucosamine deacetylase [Alphaproteobacteria bacterium]|nr:UDP-3-O-acyl-N-acetylglucosamine deacetylase [Alphaproteobacteria bacterium]